jgi:diadenosine tetraphosphate (Ap4A) HIT family hydrolase
LCKLAILNAGQEASPEGRILSRFSDIVFTSIQIKMWPPMPHGTHNFLLWEDDHFKVYTPRNPHLRYEEDLQIVIEPNQERSHSWEDPELTGKAFNLGARICQIVEREELAKWFNIQSNGNWGLLEGATPHFHVHIYGRKAGSQRWGKPIILPDLPKTYANEPMPEADRKKLSEAFNTGLS